MCLGIPGEVKEVYPEDAQGLVMGKVSFGGILKPVCLSFVPEVKVGDYVIVHVGFAISIVDKEEARFVWEYLKQVGAMEQEFKSMESSSSNA